MSPGLSATDDRVRLVVERIVKRAGRRVRDLVVAFRDDCIVVRGSAETYHAWQLAISACLEIVSETSGVRLDCRFDVMVDAPSQ